MATLEFIMQGFTARTHIDALSRLFDLPDMQRVLVSVAFVTEGGVAKIHAHLVPHAACTKVFAGIRNDATSYQGLARLHGIVSDLYTVDTGSRTLIFHPKLYLARGIQRARLLVGSANLTVSGLNNNIEAGLLLDLDLTDAADKALIDRVEQLFSASVDEYPNHIVRACSIATLDELLASGLLVDEELKAQLHPEDSNEVRCSDLDVDCGEVFAGSEASGVLQIKLKVKPQRGIISSAKEALRDSHVSKPKADPNQATCPPVLEIGARPSDEVVRPRDAPEPPIRYFRPKRRTNDGPRLRARRAKAEAIRRGKKWYFTGDPCIYGHVCDRLVSNGKCRECNRLDCEQYNRFNR